jgi:chromosome segregation protein
VFLKSLTLKGFKSFADATTLEFEPGVTVVVGPNGSGKSNIVDAVAWVLGAQGPRMLRSGKMDDVIFAGSPKRSPLGRAEVSLTIDNQAGLLPIDFSEVTVTRTLFRSGESEYAINGVPCRLLDVQELLSDTGVGRQQHVIVSQGQLDAVLNARSEDRRLIIEEAAGVLKFRRRKEKAERRLESTESSLVRLQDLLREVRRQLRPLERQAEAARRHGDLMGELHAIRRHLAGRELAAIQARLARGRSARADLARAEVDVRAALTDLDAEVLAGESQLSALRSQAEAADLADALSRAEGLRAKARGLSALLAERLRSLNRDRLASVDQDLVASLEAESVRLAADLAAVDAEQATLLPEGQELDAAELSLQAEAAALEESGEAGSATGARAIERVRAELGGLSSGVERGRGELRRIDGLLAAMDHRLSRLDSEAAELTQVAERFARAEPDMVDAGKAAHQRAEIAGLAFANAEAAARAQEVEQHRWAARAEALANALEEAKAQPGADRLAEVSGVVGSLGELVDVDSGWEPAFEAAVGDAVTAILVENVAAARRSLERLKQLNCAGAILTLPGPTVSRESVSTQTDGRDLPVGAEPIRSHVRARLPSVEQLLDRLLAEAVVVTRWIDAIDLATARPQLIVVTPEGDRFAPTGWRIRAAAVGPTAVALEDAQTRAAYAATLSQQRFAEVAHARAEADESSAAAAKLSGELDAGRGRMLTANEGLQRLERDRQEALAQQRPLAAQRFDLQARLAREAQQVAELERQLPALEEAAASEAARVLAERAARARLEQRVVAIARRRQELEVRTAGLDERRKMLESRQVEIAGRLQQHAADRHGAASRRQRLETVAAATDRLTAFVDARADQLDRMVEKLRQARQHEADTFRALTDRSEQLRRQRSTAERQLAEVRERLSRTELGEAEARVRLESLVDTVRRELDCEPDGLLAAPCPPLQPGTSPAGRVRELERELRLMGPINPLALEEHASLQERLTFLEGQLEDVRSARRELTKVIRAIDGEIVDVFRAAYVDTADNFERLFATLFPGGQGRLRLTDPDRMLDTGIEVEARPSGKNVRRLSLLSGGERSLTALAFLFAVFRSRPSPFYLMDEVEAALDDVNLHRFLDLMHEFRDEAQLLIVTHQKRTMEAADCLYGVTMQTGGSSRVVSERVTAGA